MDWDVFLGLENEQPLDRLVSGISNTAIFQRIAFVGDSLSSGEFEAWSERGERSFHDMFEYSWGQYIARLYGIKAFNFSCGGMSARDYIEGFADYKDLWNPEKACQAYVIALGVNDIINQGQTVGDISDIELSNYKNNKKTFVGYYGQIISRYKQIQPEAKFFLLTIPKSGDEKRDYLSEQHRKAIYALANVFDHTFVIDLYQYAPVYHETYRDKLWLHGHLNPSGYILTARIIDSYIDYIIRHNPEEFRRVGFIGTGIQSI